jgi:peptidyl-prolyl cis-trans isomerase D
MLDVMRKHASGWVAKILMGLLVISFAVWGVADIFGGYRSQALVTVGDTEVDAEEFRFEFQREMQQVGRQIGNSISLDQARAFGLDRRVLGRMITEATLDNDARERGLGIGDEAIARSITQDPSFRDAAGNFNRSYFEQVLRANGLTEGRYIASERQRHLRQQIATAVGTTGEPPRLLLEAVHRFQNEARTISYITVNATMIDPAGEPDDADLNEFFEGRKAQFRAPETRKIEIIDVTPDKLAETVEVTEDEITASYESRSDQFNTAEKREIHQIVFPSLEEAEAASQRIKTGAGFAAIAEERGLSQADLSLGRVEKLAMIDKAVAEAAFSLREGQVSEPVKTALGAVIVKVIDVEPGSEKTLDDMRDDLRKELAHEKAQGKVLDIYDAVEDERASGAPFSDIAAKLGLPYRVIPAIDAEGRDANGEPVADLPAESDVVSVTFDSEPGLELDAIQTTGGGFIWLNILDATPERERTLDEVRNTVVEAWRTEETTRRLAARSNELVERARNGETLEAIASELGATVQTSAPLKRGGSDEGLSPAAIQNAFAVPKGAFAASSHTNGADRVLMQVTETSVPPFAPDGEETRQVVDGMSNSISNSLLSAYIGARQEHFGVSINEQTLRAVLGER